MRHSRYALLALLLLGTAACTVGPNYAGPPKVASDAAAAGRFAREGDPSLVRAVPVARWWESLDDPLLTRLVDEALTDSPTIGRAAARLREARAVILSDRANELPSASAQATYLHARIPGSSLGSTLGGSDQSGGNSGGASSLNFYNVGFDATWEIDLFGGGRRSIEQARATASARLADLADAQVSLSAEVAQAYVNLRDVQQRVRLNTQSAQLEARMVALTRQRFAAGTASELDVERLQTQLENTEAQAVPLNAQVEQYENQLAVLTGRSPGTLDASLGTVVAVPLPPASVPIGDPAELIRHRPDIRAAERTLAASNAAIGVNVAKMFPKLNLMGIIGIGGTGLSDLTKLGNLSVLAAPMLSWNFLDFGRNRAAVDQARAQRDEADAQYRSTVLSALQDAEDSLSRYRYQRGQVAGLAKAEQSAIRASSLNQQRFQAGTTTLVDQLDVERQRLSASIGLAQSTAQLTNDYIALQKSLGLGWQT